MHGHEGCFEWLVNNQRTPNIKHLDTIDPSEVTSLDLTGDFYDNEGCRQCIVELTERLPAMRNLKTLEIGSCYESVCFNEETLKLFDAFQHIPQLEILIIGDICNYDECIREKLRASLKYFTNLHVFHFENSCCDYTEEFEDVVPHQAKCPHCNCSFYVSNLGLKWSKELYDLRNVYGDSE